ncbi:pseudaminic acid cytidylyltransferase [Bacteroidota bacterium]
MGNIAVIPARGGSKRIPRKNIKPFLGKPIIAYSIETALKSELFQEIMVSTDDDEIAQVAIRYGAKVPFIRSQKNSDDNATTLDVLLEVIEHYSTELNLNFDYGCCIYPTAPLIRIEHLTQGYQKIHNEKLDTVLPVVPFSYPVWRGLEMNEDSLLNFVWPEHINSRSQDLKPLYHDAGQWYWFDCEKIVEQGRFFTEKSGALVLDENNTQDIDNLSDWELAEMKFKRLYGS